jgi:hypothetical protein
MKDEGIQWWRARRDAKALERLQKGYRIEYYSSLGLIALGIVIAIISARTEMDGSEAILMIAFGLCGAIFGRVQLARLDRIEQEGKCCEPQGGGYSPPAARSSKPTP